MFMLPCTCFNHFFDFEAFHLGIDMNKLYKVVWNARLQCWQAVSEFAKSHSGASSVKTAYDKKRKKNAVAYAAGVAALTLSLSVSAAIHDNALPAGQQIISGSADFTQAGNTLNINQHSQHLATNWNTFNIGSHAAVNFNQLNQSSVAVNRVLDNNASQIMGRLNANGQVILINPNGVVFSKTAQVNVGGIVASTLDLQQQDVFDGKFTFTGSGKSGSVENHGNIQAQNGGTVALIAPIVKNTGSISAENGRVELTAADKVRVSLQNGQLISYDIDQGTLQGLVENSGAIIADNGVVHLTAAAELQLGRAVVNHTGYIQANRLETNAKGEIVLLGDLSNGAANISGSLVSEGKNGQAGGFIETSAATVNIADTAHVSTQAEAGGKAGKWLIDPVDFVVAAAGGNMTGAALNAALKNTDVTIQTTDTEATVSADPSLTTNAQGQGNISINDAVKWDSGKTLTLDADNNIYINHVVDAGQGAGGKLVLKYGQQSADGRNGEVYSASSGQNQPTYAGYFIQAPVHLQQGLNFSVQRGSDAANLKEFQVITDATALQNVQNNLSGYYALGSNINAGGISNFAPIGTMIEGSGPNTGNRPFTGLFDGLGHVIENLTVKAPVVGNGQGSNWGMFGKIEGADIRNVGLINAVVQGDEFVGGLIGSMSNSTLSNSFVQGTVTGRNFVGGLAGGSYFSTVDQVYSDVQVRSDNGAALLIGDNWGSALSNAYFAQADGSVTAWDRQGNESALSAGQIKLKQTYADLDWSISNAAGQNTAWRIYEGQTGPLLKAFLTPLAVKADDYAGVYNGVNQTGSGYANSVQQADGSKILGAAVYAGGGKNAGMHASSISGLYSGQNGYDLSFEQGNVIIDKATITQIRDVAVDKTYDGATEAQTNASNAVLTGKIGSDDLTVQIGRAEFADKNAGQDKTVNLLNVTLTGADADNYQLAAQLTDSANIFKKVIENIAGLQVADKVYDGTAAAVLNSDHAVYLGRIGQDQLSLTADANFDNKNAGADKTVTLHNLALSGADAGNYTFVSQPYTLKGTIMKALITGVEGIQAQNKMYDGTTAATLNTGNAVLSGMLAGDQLGVQGIGAFVDSTAGNNKQVNIQQLILTGADAQNYQLADLQPIVRANIELSQSPFVSGIFVQAPSLFEVRTVGGDLRPLGTIFLGSGSSAPAFIAQVFGSSDSGSLGGGDGGGFLGFGGGDGGVFGSSTRATIFSRDVPGVSEMNVFSGSQWRQSDLNQGLRGVFGAPVF